METGSNRGARESDGRRRDLELELARASRLAMLGELAATIAHEINDPLSAIAMNGETGLRWLDRPEPNMAKLHELLHRIINDARRASDSIERVRTMASAQTRPQTALALDELIEESIALLGDEFKFRHVAVSLDLASGLPHVTGDRIQLKQVVVNLALNAAQAMAQADAASRTLLIQTSQSEDGAIRCTFDDSGPGIAPEDLTHLFEGHPSIRDPGRGHGMAGPALGLRISRSIIEAHGGSMRADGRSTLGGARFSFELPVGGGASVDA